MRVLVCGDREWNEYAPMWRVLSVLKKVAPDSIVVHGDCRGADRMAHQIATELGLRVEAHPADWKTHGRAAGPIRNRFMIEESRRRAKVDGHELTYAVAFHHDMTRSKGTKNMVGLLEHEGIDVLKIG